jgi:type VI secretion system protein ImpA
MSELVEKLLQPISAEQPCGPDLSYDGRFDEIETILKGKPEVEIGSVQRPAEPPDWGGLREKCEEFLGASKHLRVAVILSCSLLKTRGLAGFRDGLRVIRGLLEQQWAPLYPLLDPEDNNDPTQRLNMLGSLTAARGSVYQSWLRVIDYLYAAPLCQPKGMPAITLEQLEAAKKRESGEAGAAVDGPDFGKLTAAMRSADSEQVASNHQIVQEALEAAQGIDQFLTNTLGAGGTINFEALDKTLHEMVSTLEPIVSGGAGDQAGADAGVDGAQGEVGTAVGVGGIQVRGAIRSPEDVVRAINNICEYYRQVEPCSPVPYLLRRAQKVATMNFIEAVQELNLATVDSLRPSMGAGLDGALPQSEAPPTEQT